jgi:hypothetical protein
MKTIHYTPVIASELLSPHGQAGSVAIQNLPSYHHSGLLRRLSLLAMTRLKTLRSLRFLCVLCVNEKPKLSNELSKTDIIE